jgi:hypothetical protein
MNDAAFGAIGKFRLDGRKALVTGGRRRIVPRLGRGEFRDGLHHHGRRRLHLLVKHRRRYDECE